MDYIKNRVALLIGLYTIILTPIVFSLAFGANFAAESNEYVGGVLLPVNKLLLLAPWMIGLLITLFGMIVFIYWRRRTL